MMQQPHEIGVCRKGPTGKDQDVVLSSRAICCTVAKQHQAVPDVVSVSDTDGG